MDSSAVLFNQLKAAEPFFLLVGPNVIESEEHVFRMAKHIKTVASKLGLPLVFKSSFDKANRTSSRSFRGPGMIEGLKMLEKVKRAYDIPVVTDVHETIQGEELKRQIRAIAYIECSSKTQQNLKAVFDTSIKLVLDPPKSKR